MTAPCPFDVSGPYAYDLAMQVLWIETIVDVQAPTDVEVATGEDLLEAPWNLTDLIGWELDTEILKEGKWGPFRRQRMGEQDLADQRMVFAADRAGNDVRQLWTRGDLGYIMILPSGPYLQYPTSPVNVYPVRVAQLTQRQQFRQPGALIAVTFAVPDPVGENVLIVGP